MSILVQTSTCLQPVVVFVRVLPSFVPRVVSLPSVLVSSLQSSFMMHTSCKQLEEELDVLENIDELELDPLELDLSREDDVEEEDEDESVEEELGKDEISTLEDESDEDDEDRVEDKDELVDEGELWALEEELSALLNNKEEEEHEA